MRPRLQPAKVPVAFPVLKKTSSISGPPIGPPMSQRLLVPSRWIWHEKLKRQKKIKGPRLIITLAPCPTGWDYDPKETVEIGKLAVQTGVWPLKEYIDGKVVHTKIPRQRKPVEEYLKLQGRFAHLFKPERNEKLLAEIQQRIDTYWEGVSS